MKKILKTSLIASGILLGLTACSMQVENITENDKVSSSILNEIAEYKVNTMELTFESEGNNIYGRALVPEVDTKLPTVILSHGFGGNYQQEEKVQEYLAKSGIAVYSFDFAGGSGYSQGRSEGDMIDMSVLTEKQNLIDAITLIQNQEFTDINKIYLLGASQGGVVTTLVAEEMADKIAGVYLFYPAFSMFEDTRNRFANESDIPERFNLMGLKVGRRYFKDVYNIDIFDHLAYSGQVAIYHGYRDRLVNIDNSVSAENIFPNASLTVVEGGGHGFSNKEQEYIAPMIAKSILGN